MISAAGYGVLKAMTSQESHSKSFVFRVSAGTTASQDRIM